MKTLCVKHNASAPTPLFELLQTWLRLNCSVIGIMYTTVVTISEVMLHNCLFAVVKKTIDVLLKIE